MGSRCGQIDPGVLLYLMTEKGMSAETISGLLYNESGLKGLSGLSNDMRTLEASDDPAARAAIEYFVARLKREIGGLAAMLGGVDALAFTGGIGEHSSRLREAVLTGCEWLGVTLDRQANQRDAGIISAASSRVAVFVLAVDEERIISEHAARVAGLRRLEPPLSWSGTLRKGKDLSLARRAQVITELSDINDHDLRPARKPRGAVGPTPRRRVAFCSHPYQPSPNASPASANSSPSICSRFTQRPSFRVSVLVACVWDAVKVFEHSVIDAESGGSTKPKRFSPKRIGSTRCSSARTKTSASWSIT